MVSRTGTWIAFSLMSHIKKRKKLGICSQFFCHNVKKKRPFLELNALEGVVMKSITPLLLLEGFLQWLLSAQPIPHERGHFQPRNGYAHEHDNLLNSREHTCLLFLLT